MMSNKIIFSIEVDSVKVDVKSNNKSYVACEFDETIIRDIVKQKLKEDKLVYIEDTLKFSITNNKLIVTGEAKKESEFNFAFI